MENFTKMQNKTLLKAGLKVLAMAVSLAGMSSLAHGGVIILVNGGASTDDAGLETVGESFTTPAGIPWNDIAFNFFSTPASLTPPPFASGPLAAGTAYLLTQEYLGSPASLSSLTPGFLAASTGIVAGQYIFASNVILNPNTEYWIYEDTAILTTGDGFAGTSGQQAYFGGSGNFELCDCAGDPVANFELDGSAVPNRARGSRA